MSRRPGTSGPAGRLGPSFGLDRRGRRIWRVGLTIWDRRVDLLPSLRPGDPVPLFRARASNGAQSYDFGSVAGRYVVLAFLGSAALEPARQAMAAVLEQRQLFDDRQASFFGVSADPADRATGRLRRDPARNPVLLGRRPRDQPALRCARGWARRRSAGRSLLLAGARPDAPRAGGGAARRGRAGARLVAALPPVEAHAGCPLHAPVLILPRVFEPEFCRQLIGLYQRHGGEDSGFMREIDGKTVTVLDHDHKRRARLPSSRTRR